MKNQERVWKAEQADAAEKRKVFELQREIQNERDREELKRIGQSSGVLRSGGDDKKLEWMYKGQSLNREDYLTGRAVDKHFEQEDSKEKETAAFGITVPKNHVEHECIPFSIRNFKDAQMVNILLFYKKITYFAYILFHKIALQIRVLFSRSPRQLNKLIYNGKLWKIL